MNAKLQIASSTLVWPVLINYILRWMDGYAWTVLDAINGNSRNVSYVYSIYKEASDHLCFVCKTFLCTMAVDSTTPLVLPSPTQFSQCMHWHTSVHFNVSLKHEHKWDLQPFCCKSIRLALLRSWQFLKPFNFSDMVPAIFAWCTCNMHAAAVQDLWSISVVLPFID